MIDLQSFNLSSCKAHNHIRFVYKTNNKNMLQCVFFLSKRCLHKIEKRNSVNFQHRRVEGCVYKLGIEF